MQLGIQFGHLDFGELRAAAQAAENLGFELLVVPDHLVYEGPEGQYDPHTLAHDPMIAAAVMIEATRTVRVGHLVLCNLFRHPVITAQSLSSLDHLSGGRLVAGLGTGWTAREFRMTGIPFPDVATRLRMLDEALSCIRSLWTQEHTTLQGEFYRLEEAILWPKPVQKPHPPILLGGSGNGLLRLAAKHADVVNIVAEVGRTGYVSFRDVVRLSDDLFAAKARFVREQAREYGRDPEAITISNVVFTLALADSRSETETLATNLAAMLETTPEAVTRSPLALVGTPEDCIRELRRRRDEWGVSQIIFPYSGERDLRILAETVLAHV